MDVKRILLGMASTGTKEFVWATTMAICALR